MRKRRPGRPTLSGAPMGLYAFRLPADLVAQVDAYAKQLLERRPGSIGVTRTEAVRALLMQGLTGTSRRRSRTS